MPDRLIAAAAALAAAALAATAPAVRSSFTATSRPGPSTFAAAAEFAPRSILRPTIEGAPRDGETLRGTPGTWHRPVHSTSGTWLRDGAPVGTGEAYAVTAADVGHVLSYRVAATNGGGSTAAESAPTNAVLPAPPTNTTAPRIAGGDPVVGSVLTVAGDTWSGSPTSFDIRWYRCLAQCRTIEGATDRELLVTGEDVSGAIGVEVTARNAGGSAHARAIGTHTVGRAPYTHVLCRDPDDGRRVAPDGELPDGLTFGRSSAAFPDPSAQTRCASGDGVPLSTAGRWSVAGSAASAWLQYRAAAGTTFHGATLFRHVALSGGFGWGLDGSQLTGTNETPRWDGCAWNAGCVAAGSLADPFGAAGRVAIERGHVEGFNVVLACQRLVAPGCEATGAETVTLLGGRVRLSDQLNPSLTSQPSGGLATDRRLEGTEEITFAATDGGAGLYRVRVRIGTREVAAQPIAPNDPRCADADPGDDDLYEFADQRPCPASVATTLRFDTTGWPTTGRLRVLLEDAGRNTVHLVDRDVGA